MSEIDEIIEDIRFVFLLAIDIKEMIVEYFSRDDNEVTRVCITIAFGICLGIMIYVGFQKP